MKCPSCGSNDFKVLDSRPTDGKTIRRRRECQNCQKRFTTYEIIEAVPLSVVKKNGTLEIFDPNKIIAGVRRACYKRPVTDEQIQELVTESENELANNLKENITSEEIGNMVMDKLYAALDICTITEKKLVMTGRDTGATGAQFADYIMETIEKM